jgi:hypothetical protein
VNVQGLVKRLAFAWTIVILAYYVVWALQRIAQSI